MIRHAVLAALLLPFPALALDLSLPGTARLLAERNTDVDRYQVPVAVFDGAALPSVAIEGPVARASWRLDTPSLTPLQIIRPLRSQLETAGFRIVLDCVAAACGGFDFRFATEVLPAPNMYVDIASFHFIAAVTGPQDTPGAAVTILASTTANGAYVQIIQAGDVSAPVSTDAAVPRSTPPPPSGPLAETLIAQGHVVLAGLEFETGSADLGAGPFGPLADLASLMRARPGLRVALVGHTDSVGSLAGNIALSKRRAQSVRQRMMTAHGIEGARMEAEGMGYLSPVASNLDSAGRDANRRVEVILLDE